MAELKFTKNELRAQQKRLMQLNKYLPTLQLKKAMLQLEVSEARMEIEGLQKAYAETKQKVDNFSSLLTDRESISLEDAATVVTVNKRFENIAGVEVPYYENIDFAHFEYRLFDAPPWVDAAIMQLRRLAEAKAEVEVAEEKKAALEKELREVSIRVNLFEKVLIPRARKNIKKIKVFLGDQELSAVSQAKVAKAKIVARKLARKEADTSAEAFYAN